LQVRVVEECARAVAVSADVTYSAPSLLVRCWFAAGALLVRCWCAAGALAFVRHLRWQLASVVGVVMPEASRFSSPSVLPTRLLTRAVF
jgi:hypothetical protein